MCEAAHTSKGGKKTKINKKGRGKKRGFWQANGSTWTTLVHIYNNRVKTAPMQWNAKYAMQRLWQARSQPSEQQSARKCHRYNLHII